MPKSNVSYGIERKRHRHDKNYQEVKLRPLMISKPRTIFKEEEKA